MEVKGLDANSLEKYLIQIEDILEAGKTSFMSSKVSVDKELIYEIIDEIRLNLPAELKESKKIIDTKDKYLREAEKRSETAIELAHQEADTMLEEAERRASRLVSDHEISRRAIEEAEVLLEEAKRDAKDIRLNAMEYADEILSKAEGHMRSTLEKMDREYNASQNEYHVILDILYENRQQLRGK